MGLYGIISGMDRHYPKLMGILNCTPDSFFDQGAYCSTESAIARGIELWKEGADLIDVGGASSRPGACLVNTEEELERTLPVVQALSSTVPIPISIDTCNPRVAEQAIKFGARLINDISGFTHPAMREIAASTNTSLCLMHMLGTPQTMQQLVQTTSPYPRGVVWHVTDFFDKQLTMLVQAGVKENRITLDPGIGFGKTTEDNFELLRAIPHFKARFNLRILIGASRKSFMGKVLAKPAKELLPATLTIHTMSLIAGADILRAHDITAHRDLIALFAKVHK